MTGPSATPGPPHRQGPPHPQHIHRPPGGLPGRLVAFVGALRDAGLPVSTSETVDAARAMTTIPLHDREALKAAYALTLVKREAYRVAFDRLFDLWWPPSVGDPVPPGAPAPPGDGDTAADGTGPPGTRQEGDRSDAGRMREDLVRLLLDGDDAGLRRLAQDAVAAFGAAETQPGRQSYFGYRALRALSPDTLRARLVAALLAAAGEEPGGLAERVAQQVATDRIARFREYVEAEVRRRLAEEKGPEALARSVVPPLAEQVEFLRASRDDLAVMRREVNPLAHRLAARLAARRRHGTSGRLDVRRTMRAAVSTGGVPLVTHHRPHRPHKPEIVLLCDVSGSVAGFAHFTLLLVMALREQFTRVRAFAFVDTCDEVTKYFGPGADAATALDEMVRGADVVWFDGHSDYGRSLETFAARYPDALGPRTSFLILGDARNNFRATGVGTLRTLAGRARHTYWLNPEPARMWGSADSAAPAYADVVPMVECRNVTQLGEFVTRLLPTH